jgi:multidrug efflux pump subunit AcrA (membrane-fusion protein)
MAFATRARLDNPDRVIPSGVTADIEIETYGTTDAILLNRREIVEDGDQSYVYIADGDRARRRPIRPGRAQGLIVEIADGLAPGDAVIVRGIELVDDGTPVRVVGRDDAIVQR